MDDDGSGQLDKQEFQKVCETARPPAAYLSFREIST